MTMYYHGGKPGLGVGDRILPASETGDPGTLLPYARVYPEDGAPRADRVYVTTDRDTARSFAYIYPNGALYRVEPDEPIEDDPNCGIEGVSFQATGATIVSVYDRCVSTITPRQFACMLYGPPGAQYKRESTENQQPTDQE